MLPTIRLDRAIVSLLFNIPQLWSPASVCTLSLNLILIPSTYHLVVRRQQVNSICCSGLGVSGLCHFPVDLLSSEGIKIFCLMVLGASIIRDLLSSSWGVSVNVMR